MAAGSLVVNIQTLQTALAGISTLLGEGGANGSPGSGFAGAASLSATSPTDRVGSFSGSFRLQVDGLLEFDASASLSQATDFFGTLQVAVQAPPTAALATFEQ